MKKQENKGVTDASRRNRYSIRKFTVGAASIVVGATVLFGLGEEAKAAETSTTSENETTSTNVDDSSKTDEADQTTNDEQVSEDTSDIATQEKLNQDTTDTSSEQSEDVAVDEDNAKTDEENTTSSETTTSQSEETQKEDVSTSEQDNTNAQKEDDATQDETPTREENNEKQEETSTQKDNSAEKESSDSNKTETHDEDTTPVEQTEGNPESSDSVDETKSNESTPQTKSSEPQSSNETLQNSNLNEQSEKVIDEVDVPTTDSNNASQQLTSANETTQQPVEKSKFQEDNGLANNQEVQQLAEQAGVKATDSPEVAMAKILQQSSDNKDANTIEATTSQPSAMRRMMAYNAVEPQSTSSNTTTPTAQAIATYASPSQGTTAPIVADAIANGYIKGQTDATNARNTLSGRAWEIDRGTPATMSNGLTAVPEGTDVYMQWIDRDGAVSPVYTAKTTNELSKSNGSQVGPGAYAFDLREGWTDLDGKEHIYRASNGQDYRLWINDYETEEGNTATMLRQAGGFYPGSYVNSVTYSNLGQFPLIGTNMQRTGIFMAVRPTGGYMEKDEADQIHDTEGPINAPSVNLNAKNTVSGKVWLETGAGDYANSATGPNNNSADPQAAGYTVVMSSLTSEGAKAYDDQVNSLSESERAAAAKALLEEHPEYISATVYGETNEDGRYTLRFPEGTLNTRHMYGYVKSPEGNVVNTYSSFTSPQFRAPNSNLSWTPQTAPAQNLVANPMWYNVNFAVVPTADLAIDILKYDTTTTPATPGSNVDIKLPGTTMSPLPTHIEWRDGNGNVVVKTDEFTTVEEGEELGKFQVPEDAKSGDIYTAYLVTGGNDVSADSFIVQTYAEIYEPESSEVKNPYNTPTTEDQVTGNVTVPDYPEDQEEQPEITVDNPSELPDGTTPGTVEVPVTVTYPDGSQDHVTVPVTTASPLSDEYDPTTEPVETPYGTPTTEEDVTGNVTVPGYPEDEEQPEVTVNDPSSLPDGTTPGTVEIPVTVTYPDGSTDETTVEVTTGNPQADSYDPTALPVNNPNGTPTTEDQVTGNVTVPNYPEDEEQPEITVDDPSLLPDGTTPGTVEVPVTVTYPDGSQDKVTVPVTTADTVASQYEPTTEPVETPYGTPTTEEDVTGNVSVPDYPEDQEQPKVTVDNPSELPDGTTPGTVEIPVTVTYPDGSQDKVIVDVTTGNPQADSYEPTTEPVETPYGTPTTEEDVTGNVTVPGYPEDEEQPEITVDDPSSLPDGTTPGTVEIPVTVTYPDGSTDETTVEVTTGNPQADSYDPTTEPVETPYGTPTTEEDVTGNVTVPDYPEDEEQPKITVNDPSLLPDGTTPGTVEIPVTVTYPDGSQDKVVVEVTTGNPQADSYEPTTEPVETPYGTPTTEEDVTGNVTVPGYPEDQEQPEVTVDDPSLLPDGTTPGTVEIPVTVTYPDGSQDHVTVPVTTTDKTSDTTAPDAPEIDGVTEGDNSVTGTGNPGDTITVTFPDGSTSTGTVDEDGNWTVDVPEGTTVKKDDTISATATDDEDNTSESTTVTVTGDNTTSPDNQATTPDAPVINPVDKTDDAVTGTGTPGNEVTVTFPDGSTATGTVDNDGNWTVDVPEGLHLQDSDNITAVETDKDGNTSKETSVTVTGDQNGVTPPTNDDNQGDSTVVTPDAPVINDVPTNSPSVTGTGTPGHTVEVTFPDGHVETTTVNDQGSWSAQVPKGESLEDGDVVTAVDVDQSGNPSEVVRATVGDEGNTEEALPDTGETNNTNNATLFGGLFAALGSIFLFGRRRKDNKDNR